MCQKPLNHPAAVYWQAFQPKKQRALRWNYLVDGASEIVVAAAVHAEADVGSTVDTAGAAYHGNLLVGVGPYYVSRAPNP